MIYKKISDELDVSDEQIEAICTSMHKTTREERHWNCRLCGFNSCEQMVAAILLGMREKEQCVQYSESKLLSVNTNLDTMIKLLYMLAKCNKAINDLKNSKKIFAESIENLIKIEKEQRVLYFQNQCPSVKAEKEVITEFLDKLNMSNKTIDNFDNTKKLVLACVEKAITQIRSQTEILLAQIKMRQQ